MTRPRPFRSEQRAVAVRMAVALIVTIVVVGVAWWWAPTTASFEMRLQSALRMQIAVWLCVAIAIGNVARLRFVSPDDIAGSGEGAGSGVVQTANAVLRNTLEQAALAGATYLALAATEPRSGGVTVVLVTLFVIGRLSFAAGYRRGAAARAFGFALTFYPTVVGLLLAAVATVMPPAS